MSLRRGRRSVIGILVFGVVSGFLVLAVAEKVGGGAIDMSESRPNREKRKNPKYNDGHSFSSDEDSVLEVLRGPSQRSDRSRRRGERAATEEAMTASFPAEVNQASDSVRSQERNVSGNEEEIDIQAEVSVKQKIPKAKGMMSGENLVATLVSRGMK